MRKKAMTDKFDLLIESKKKKHDDSFLKLKKLTKKDKKILGGPEIKELLKRFAEKVKTPEFKKWIEDDNDRTDLEI
jgi:hypothetical protein